MEIEGAGELTGLLLPKRLKAVTAWLDELKRLGQCFPFQGESLSNCEMRGGGTTEASENPAAKTILPSFPTKEEAIFQTQP